MNSITVKYFDKKLINMNKFETKLFAIIISYSKLLLLTLVVVTANAENTIRYEIDFETQPDYIPNNTIVLTYDDGPDYTNTPLVLDALKKASVSATFFINTNNWNGSVDTNPTLQSYIKRIVNEGHELGSHTVHHYNLSTLNASQIEHEITGVQATVDKIFGNNEQNLTLFRAPYGEPYENHTTGYSVVSPIVAKYAVEIGWSIDAFDYKRDCNTNCVINNVIGEIKNGSYGIILNHFVYAKTAQAIPTIVDYIRSNGYQLWTVEQVVKAKFGKSSYQLIYG